MKNRTYSPIQAGWTTLKLIKYIHFVIRKRMILLSSVGSGTFLLIVFFTYLVTPTWEGNTIVLIERSSKQTLSIFKDVNLPVRETRFVDNFNLQDLLMGQNMAHQIVQEFTLDERLKNKRFHPEEMRAKIKNIMVNIFLSPVTLLQMIGSLEKGEKNWHDEAVEDFLDNWTDIEAVEGTSTIDIKLYGETPQLAMDIANRMVELLIERTQDFTRKGAKSSYDYLAERLKTAEQNVAVAELALATYKKEKGIYYMEEEKKLKAVTLSKFKTELLSTIKEGEELDAQMAAINWELENQQERAILPTIIAKNPITNDLQSSLINLEIKLASLLQEKTEEHPEVLALKAAVQENRQKHEITLRAESDANKAKKRALEKIIRHIKVEFNTLSEKELMLVRLKRVLDLNRSIYYAMEGRLEKLAIEQQSLINEYNIRVLDRAYVPKSADSDSPNWLLNIIVGIFLSCIFGFGGIFFIEYFNDAITFPEDVEKKLAIPFIGSVPNIKQ